MTHTLHEPTLPHLSQLGGYESFGGRCDLVRLALSAGRLAEAEDRLDSGERQPRSFMEYVIQKFFKRKG